MSVVGRNLAQDLKLLRGPQHQMGAWILDLDQIVEIVWPQASLLVRGAGQGDRHWTRVRPGEKHFQRTRN
jgi:hypothetical protein